MQELDVDYGMKGEGAESLLEAIKALINGRTLAQIPRIVTKQIPYSEACCYIKTPLVEYENKLVEHYWQQSGMLNIQTKRGCPYNCIYCT